MELSETWTWNGHHQRGISFEKKPPWEQLSKLKATAQLNMQNRERASGQIEKK